MATNPPPDPKSGLWNLIANHLRHCREQRGLSGEAVGRIINASKATVSRIENGKDRLDPKQAALLDTAWDTGGHFGYLVWYASIGHSPQWLAEYTEFEQRSRLVRVFEPLVITGLFQTPEYARELFLKGGEPDLDKSLTDRIDRQEILKTAFVVVVLSEFALRWPVGSPVIMGEQLARVLELAEKPNVLVHVVPATFNTGAYKGLDGGLKLLTGDEFGEVAYTESIGGGRLVSSPSEVAEFAIKFARILGSAVPEHQSMDLIRGIMEEFSEDLAEE